MRERGVRAVTTNAIAERADIKIGSLYDYFSNKEAVIAELYEEKLAEVRAFLDVGASRIVRASWREQTADLIRGMWTYQLGIGLDRTLVDASYYYEDLLRIARAHSQLFATTFARLLKRLGSSWREDELHDLGISVYTLVNATWSYWRLTEFDRPIAIERQIALSPCSDGDSGRRRRLILRRPGVTARGSRAPQSVRHLPSASRTTNSVIRPRQSSMTPRAPLWR